jgi:hypothetical protein
MSTAAPTTAAAAAISATPIYVFPDSGHHYTFVPLPKETLAQYPQFRALCSQERQAWRNLHHSWVRGRPGTREGVPGFWVAVESNLGSVKRGSIYDPKRQLPAESVKPEELENPSPYASTQVSRLPEAALIPIKFPAPPPAPAGTLVEVAQLQVIWKEPNGEPIDVDVIIDFGNTRTVVLGLENITSEKGQLSSVCKPIRFIKRGYDYEPFDEKGSDDTCAIVDSWFILHEPVFASLEPPAADFRPVREVSVEDEQIPGRFGMGGRVERKYFVTARAPQMFIELSPVVMGDSARAILGQLNIEAGGNYSMSSPKRYAWDNEQVGGEGMERWTMVLNHWNPNARALNRQPKMEGSMLRFLPTDGRDWPIDAPPNEDSDQTRRPSPSPAEAVFPRSEAVTWSALAILELAYRQVTSEEWRKASSPFIPRRLRKVLVTFPSGWSTEERDAYRRKWEKALNIFTLTHLDDRRAVSEGGQRPELMMDLDEAVASQLPFVYSEIRRLHNEGESWIELFGRGTGTQAKVRLMTVDIGGGTTDISIVEYQDPFPGRGVNLKARLLFRDSSSTAGDVLAKALIERVLLPIIGQPFHGDGKLESAFTSIFSRAHQRTSDKPRWSRIVKLVFLPIIRQWLRDLSNNSQGNPEQAYRGWTPGEILGAEGRLVDEAALAELNKICEDAGLPPGTLSDTAPLEYNMQDVVACVERVFGPVLNSLAKYVTAFEVDLVTLSGKPSELPQVKKLLEERLPILPQRVIQARNFPAGDWYPMSHDNTIHDAKSVTAVGAALYQAIRNGKIPDWRLESIGQASPRNYWGAMPMSGRNPNRFSQLILPSDHDVADVEVMIPTAIGRKLLPSAAKPEQVYRLRWSKKALAEGRQASEIIGVTFERHAAERPGETERLKLGGVNGTVNGKPVTLEDVDLQLCTLEGDDFWVDSGRFEVFWPGESNA